MNVSGTGLAFTGVGFGACQSRKPGACRSNVGGRGSTAAGYSTSSRAARLATGGFGASRSGRRLHARNLTIVACTESEDDIKARTALLKVYMITDGAGDPLLQPIEIQGKEYIVAVYFLSCEDAMTTCDKLKDVPDEVFSGASVAVVPFMTAYGHVTGEPLKGEDSEGGNEVEVLFRFAAQREQIVNAMKLIELKGGDVNEELPEIPVFYTDSDSGVTNVFVAYEDCVGALRPEDGSDPEVEIFLGDLPSLLEQGIDVIAIPSSRNEAFVSKLFAGAGFDEQPGE